VLNHWKIQNSGDSQYSINSIRRSANYGEQPMERRQWHQVFYDVIRLEAICGGSIVRIEGHFWRFWGHVNPKMLSAIVWTPKRHFLTLQRVFWAIVRQNPSTGNFIRRVREKK